MALMHNRLWILIVSLLVLLGGPEVALAWGPATHVGLGASLLEHAEWLPASIAALLTRHGIAFLYGNIAADIVFAKRWSRVKQFCHHWLTGFDLLDQAESDSARAFAYGYLSHLAADTVAHAKYIPHQVAISDCGIGSGHFFWELRADAAEDDASWRLLENVLRYDHSDHHARLQSQITGTFLSFDLNRRLFEGINALALRRSFRRSVHIWNRHSRWYLAPELVQGYRAESLERIISLLTDGAGSPVLREDPNGTSALMSVRVYRRDVRRLKRRGLAVDHHLLEVAHAFAPSPAR